MATLAPTQSRNRRYKPGTRRSMKLGGWIALILVSAFTLFPIFWMVISSLKSNQELLLGNTIFPSELHFENYRTMWERSNFFVYFRNSLIICGITAVICTVLAVFSSYALARFRFPGSEVFGIAVLATQLIPGVMFLLPLYNMFIWLKTNWGIGLLDTYQGMVFVYVAFFLPLSLWILRSFFAAIPPDLEEQAMIDGTTRFGAFIRVIIPLSGPGIIATSIYVFLTAWDELLFAMQLTNTVNTQTIPVGIRLFVGTYQNRYDEIMAAATVITLPILLIFFFLQKYMISGMTSGAVKG